MAEVEAMDVSAIEAGSEKISYEELCEHANAIAKPMADKKLNKKILKLVKKAAAEKSMKQGVSDVHREIRKAVEANKGKDTPIDGMVILAGNVYPIDVYSHVPAWCDDVEIPFVFVPSKEQLGAACGHKRNAVLVYVKPNDKYEALYTELKEQAKGLVVSVE
ncbi:hypothetical protein L596_027334 [Steinernema carpocapsae]|uniref:Ribosomal protein eL8/eL30/eS12/Gadd45 domain-containing protein n=1 Tax=Steinernema carpocapsae TaxID=34508 RepID=A0A4U5M414_STECR|nr:hypothetical protein L596_027334 [Steinernema carpocapsae]